jgi:hypothetical protein
MACAVQMWEFPMSVLAILGVTEFGRMGPLRYTWSILAVVFHFGVLLLLRPNYDVQTHIIIALVLDFPMGLLPRLGIFKSQERQGAHEARQRPTRARSNQLKLALALMSSMIVAAWLLVGVTLHHVDKDPNWPISSIPMYSTLFFMDPSVKNYTFVAAVNTKDPDFDGLSAETQELVLAGSYPLNLTSNAVVQNLIDKKIVLRNPTTGALYGSNSGLDVVDGSLRGLSVPYHRCYHPHFSFPGNVFMGQISDSVENE